MVYINSPGGVVTSGLAITTRCSTSAATSRRRASAGASMARFCLAAGTSKAAASLPQRPYHDPPAHGGAAWVRPRTSRSRPARSAPPHGRIRQRRILTNATGKTRTARDIDRDFSPAAAGGRTVSWTTSRTRRQDGRDFFSQRKSPASRSITGESRQRDRRWRNLRGIGLVRGGLFGSGRATLETWRQWKRRRRAVI